MNKTNILPKDLCKKLVENNIWVNSAKYFWAEQAYYLFHYSHKIYKWELITEKERPSYCKSFMPAPTKEELKRFVEKEKKKYLRSDECFVNNIIKNKLI